jgi:hypothetical protein
MIYTKALLLTGLLAFFAKAANPGAPKHAQE